MISNKDITVINESNGVYYGTFLRGVSFIGKTARTATEQGLLTADYFTVRIAEHLIRDYGTFTRSLLQAENGSAFETESGYYLDLETSEMRVIFIPQKTMIVVGAVTDSELQNIKQVLRTHEVYTVVSVGDNRHGSTAIRHWRIDCK